MRKIPATMATQHPDNALPSSLTGKRFVTTRDEIEECYHCFAELGIEEYMWDWEGKYVDEAVIERLFQKYYDYFQKHPLGEEKFLTFRIPNIWEEPSYKLPRAFMNMIAAEQAARQFKLPRPVFEAILPMTTSAEQLCSLQKSFSRIAAATSEIFETESEMRLIDLIPLFEQVETMADSYAILERYLGYLQTEHGHKPEYLRVFLARSDPAMNAGLIPCVLAVKHALASLHRFGERSGIAMYPWIGAGALPFRGGVSPERTEMALAEYKGTASLTVQSSFRYDYPADDVKEAIAEFNWWLPENRLQAIPITEKEGKLLREYNEQAAGFFRQTIEQLAPYINLVAAQLPDHRERVQHIGIFGYSRGVGKVKLPRAIKFTGALYSLGVPPELIGSGQALKLARETKMLPLVEKLYINLRADLVAAGDYLNRENLELLCRHDAAWECVRESITEIERYLGVELGPRETRHLIHRNFASNIYHRLQEQTDIGTDVLAAAAVRRSLG